MQCAEYILGKMVKKFGSTDGHSQAMHLCIQHSLTDIQFMLLVLLWSPYGIRQTIIFLPC